MKFQVSKILFLWSFIGFIDRMETSAVQKRATSSSAQSILNNMDQTQNPCEDFYQFACGGFIAKNPLPADRTQYGTPEILAHNALEQIQKILQLETPDSSYYQTTPEVKKAQNMYANCMTEENDVQVLKSVVQTLGGWPLTTPTLNTQTISIEVLLAKMASLTGTNPIISAFVDIDLTNSNNYILQVDDGVLAVEQNFIANETTKIVYYNLIQAIAQSFGTAITNNIKSQIYNIINFNLELAAITPTEVEPTNFTAIYQKMTIDELQQQTDPSVEVFSWVTYFNELTNLSLTSNEPIGVYNLEYLIKALQLVKSTDKNTVLNYIMWCFVENYAWTAGGPILAADLLASRTLKGLSKNVPRNTTCTDFVNSIWGFALAKPYVANTFPSSNIQQVQQVAQSLLDTFHSIASSNISYLTGTSQTVAIDKIDTVKLLIGYPAWINNDTAVQEYFANYPPMNSTHVINSLNGLSSQAKQNLQLLGTPVDRSRFDTLPSDAEVVYDLSLNSITLPAAVLQQPIFSSEQLKALDYGTLGYIVGYEANNGLNQLGSQFDANGNLNDWWSTKVAQGVGKDAACLTEQYNNYCSKTQPNQCINGSNTATEHIGDYEGIFGAYITYEQWVAKNGPEPKLPGLTNYTAEQLLFINFAQQYCTATVPENIIEIFQYDSQLYNRYRVIGVLSDVSAFATTFNCPVGPMNRGNSSCIPY